MLRKTKSNKRLGHDRGLSICSLIREAESTILAWNFRCVVDENIQGASCDLSNLFRGMLSWDSKPATRGVLSSRTVSVSGLSKSPDTMYTFLLSSASCFRS